MVSAPVRRSAQPPGARRWDGSTEPPFVWVGGDLVLDFHNTAVWTREESPLEESPIHDWDLLGSYRNLVLWCDMAGVIRDREAQMLLDEAERYPEEAARITGMAVEVRSLIHAIFGSVARTCLIEGATLAALNVILTETMTRLRIVRDGSGFTWTWMGAGASLDRPLWPIVRASAELMTSPSLARIKVCEGERCGFMFLDTSRRGRRWCDMALCGNRAKARRHYARTRVLGEPAGTCD